MRILVGMIGLIALVACGGVRDDLSETPEPIGQFLLGHNVVYADSVLQGPISRNGTPEQWTAAMESAIDARFNSSRFPGEAYYHIGVSVDGYILAPPGIPLIYSPKSVLIITVNFFEDATRRKLNDEAIQLTVFEPCCTVPLLGSGYTRSAEEQMEGLSFNAARAIERTMRRNADWFGGTPENLADDATIVEGNLLEDNPDLLAPSQSPPPAS